MATSYLVLKFLVIWSQQITKLSVKDVNLWTITDMQSWCRTWLPIGSSRIRAEQKLLREPKGACKSSWKTRGNLKSFALTIPWNLANLVKISPGIIVRQHDQKLVGLQKEQCAEWKVDLRYCCNQVWTRNGGQIPWNAKLICGTFKISCVMGGPHMKDVLENLLKDQLPRLDMWDRFLSSNCVKWTCCSEKLLHFFLLARKISQRIFEHVLPCRRTTRLFLREFFFPTWWLFSCSSRNTCLKHVCKCFNNDFIRFAFTLSTSRNFRDQEMMWVHQDQRFPSFYSTWEPCSAFSSHSKCHPQRPTGIILVLDEQQDIPNSVFFPIQVPIEFLHTVFPIGGLQVGDRAHFIQEEPLEAMSANEFGHGCRGRRVHTSGHSDFGILSNLGVSSSFTWVRGYCISCLSVAIWQSCNIIHCFCGSHLGHRRALFSEDCIGSGVRPCLYSSSVMLVLSPRFWGDICPSMWQSGLCFCLFVLPEYASSRSWLFPTAAPELSQVSSIPFPLLLVHVKIFIACGTVINLWTRLYWSSKYIFCLQCGFLCASTIHAYFVFGTLWIQLRYQFPGAWMNLLFARHGRVHRPFQFHPRILLGFPVFFVIRIFKAVSSQSSSTVEFFGFSFFFNSCFFSILSCFSNFAPYISDHTWSGLVVVWTFVILSPDHICPWEVFLLINWNLWNFSSNLTCKSSMTFKKSSILFSCMTSRSVWVDLAASMCFSGTGNVSSFGTKSWTRGSLCDDDKLSHL